MQKLDGQPLETALHEAFIQEVEKEKGRRRDLIDPRILTVEAMRTARYTIAAHVRTFVDAKSNRCVTADQASAIESMIAVSSLAIRMKNFDHERNDVIAMSHERIKSGNGFISAINSTPGVQCHECIHNGNCKEQARREQEG